MATYGQLYAWAAGSGVALAALANIANEVGARNRRTAGGALYPVGITSAPVDVFPVRWRARSGIERGGGFIEQSLTMTLAKYGLKYILDTYLSSGTVVSAAMTFYLRRHELDTYARYNGYLVLPSPQRGDMTYVRQGVFNVTFTITKLVAL